MSQIQKIRRMDHPGVIRNFSWSSDLPDFARYNLIYGWNASGKTTLSRFLRDLETRQEPSIGEISVRIDGNDIEGNEFPNAQTHIRVFNRDFVEDSVFPVGDQDVPPIYVVGKANVAKQREVEQLKGTKTTKDRELSEARNESNRATEELDKHCIREAIVVKNSLRVSGSGAYNDYNKTMYRERATKMLADSNADAYRLDEASRDKLQLQHRATDKPSVDEVAYEFPDLAGMKAEVEEILATTVVSSTIAVLQDDPELANWSRDGLTLHQERQSKSCLFCQQLIPPQRLEDLEAHFNEQYEQFLDRVVELRKQLQEFQKQSGAVDIPNRSEFFEDIAPSYHAAKSNLLKSLRSVNKFVAASIECVDRKQNLPFRRLETDLAIPMIDSGAIDDLNNFIQEHNETCDDFESRKIRARDELALDQIATNSGIFEQLKETASDNEAEVCAIEKQIKLIDQKIERIESEIVLFGVPAHELNDDLHNYLGHKEIQLDVKDTGYTIVRNGVQATSLSEGEKTALALLYFLKSLQDQSFDTQNGVVVIDDPVSSLDANSLYMAFGFIRQRLEDAGQIILLTHNFTFFRQVQNWFKYLPNRDRQFYMLEQVSDTGPRRSTFSTLDPMLERYGSEYHYLFSLVYKTANSANIGDLERYYGLPNVARRLLENFLAFRQPQNIGELWKSLKQTDLDEAKRSRIIRFVHEYSHNGVIGPTDRDLSLLSEAQPVLRDIMEFINSQDQHHYLAMVELVEAHE